MDSPGRSFDYAFVVPKDMRGPMRGAIRDGCDNDRDCLVGPAPLLTWTEYSPDPWRLLAWITLSASARDRATAAAASFSVERGLLRVLRPGDVVHLTYWRRVSLSILRGDQLIAAAGDMGDVPLGGNVTVGDAADLIREANAVFQRRDPEYRMLHYPIELTIDGKSRLLQRGRPTVGEYDVFITPSRWGGSPCVSMERRGVCPETAAHTSAQLLDAEGVQILDHWRPEVPDDTSKDDDD